MFIFVKYIGNKLLFSIISYCRSPSWWRPRV